MQRPTDLNRTIVEDLYCEALMLADEVRSVFDLTPIRETGEDADRKRLAVSVEGLRTTTRVMHVLAWLLNHRAFFAGELSEFQLRRHSRLPADRAPDEENLALLSPQTRQLALESEKLHQRIARLDEQWSARFESRQSGVFSLHERLNKAISQI